jgi:DNA-directed RNA polymerase subunit K/omega
MGPKKNKPITKDIQTPKNIKKNKDKDDEELDVSDDSENELDESDNESVKSASTITSSSSNNTDDSIDNLNDEHEIVIDDDENFINDDVVIKTKSNKCSQPNYEEEDDDASINIKMVDEEINIGNLNESINYQKDSRISKPILTKYEKTRCLGIRANQLIQGAKPMIKNCEALTPIQIAYLELKHKTIPLIIHRPIPNAADEIWDINELEYEFTEDDESKINSKY